jgi:hypothetical protein
MAESNTGIADTGGITGINSGNIESPKNIFLKKCVEE